jgi:hypothetical protein
VAGPLWSATDSPYTNRREGRMKLLNFIFAFLAGT